MIKVDWVANVKKIIDDFNSTKEKTSFQFDKINKSEIFDNFYKECLWYFEVNFRAALANIENRDFHLELDEIVLCSVKSLRNDLIDISKKVLISELYKMKENNQLLGADKYERYEYFNSLLSGRKKLEIIESNPVLAYLIINKLHTKTNLLKECFERFAADFRKIKNTFDIDIKTIKNISLDEGDTHNDGKSVIILQLDDNKKLVYKPHTMAPDESFINLIEYINSKRYLKCSLKAARAINKGTYGWQEFISYRECEDESQIRAHFYRIGVLIALFNILKSKDFHFENLIASGEYPVPIDLETILSNRKNDINEGKFYLAEAFVREIDQSIYGSLMIPQNLEMFGFSVDMSGINGGNHPESLEFTRILNTGTDEIGYEKVKASLQEKQNRVRHKGNLVELQFHIPDIEQGLNDGYEFFIEYRDELISLIENQKIFSGDYRQVLRATANYVKFIDAAIHPVYTGEFDSRIKVLSYLYGKAELTEGRKARITSEINQLFRNDVPYFWASFNSRDLHSADGACFPEYYEKTMCDLVLERIRKANIKEKEKQVLYMKASIASLINIQDSHKYAEKYTNNIFKSLTIEDCSKDNYLKIAEKIGEYLEEICIWNSEKDKCSLMALNFQADGSIKYGPLNRKLYEGSGVLLFLAQLARLTRDNKYIDMIKGIVFGFEELFNKAELQITFEGLFTGIGSMAYIYYNLWKVLGEQLFYDRYKEWAAKLTDFDFMKSESLDVIDGAAGLSIMLSNIYSKENDSVVLELMQKCGEKLYHELTQKQEGHLTGFSHGYAGFSTALFILAHHLNKDEYYILAKALVDRENQHFNDENKNWMDLRTNHKEADPVLWCHGASGIALSRVLSKQYLREHDKDFLDKDIETATSKTLECGFASNMNHSLCHGIFGNIDCLLTIAVKAKDMALMDKVYKIADEECKKIIEQGIECANPLRVETINFMLGITGIGYELLRLYDNNIPSVLALEV